MCGLGYGVIYGELRPTNQSACQVAPTGPFGGNGRRLIIDVAFLRRFRYYMTANIQWDANALFEGTQAGNPRSNREKGLGAAAREGRARHRRRRFDEGRRPHPWRVLRAFRFAGSASDRSVWLRDGPLNRA